MNFGSFPEAPLNFMDDIIHGSEVEEARLANNKVDIVTKQLRDADN